MSEILIAQGDAAATSPTYEELLADIKSRVHLARTRAVHAANAELIGAYWYIGKEILRRQEEDGVRRGRAAPKIVERLSADLRAAFPDMSGFSVANLNRMRRFAAAWPDDRMWSHAVTKLPWGHICILLNKLDDRQTRDWYAARAGQWTRTVLEHHIHTRLHEREGAVLSNFDETLLAGDADGEAPLLLRDPLVVDFVTSADARRERSLENALVADITRFMHALGDGFLYAGRQRAIDLGEGATVRLDLLFYHHPTARWVVIDLKLTEFKPEYAGKMNLYINAVDELVAREGDKPTVGFILCTGRRETEARMTLRGIANPLAIGRYVVGAKGVEPSEEPVDATGGLEEELASLARVERQVTQFAARRASELKSRGSVS
ncbi:MAG TPA: PDDEXK nuclease domain-containing protein [Conexibacter sp.]|jgi:predicted nuclease of restriction endonuclease-like (RecB) superfamily|nr:PDDEXK nuclease domain-containing protein [Conexibacter sp.]